MQPPSTFPRSVLFWALVACVATAAKTVHRHDENSVDPNEKGVRDGVPRIIAGGGRGTSSQCDHARWFPLAALTAPAVANTTFQSLLFPFMKAISLSYTATYGGYYRPRDVTASPDGYTKSSIVSNPESNCGMRALTFVEKLNMSTRQRTSSDDTGEGSTTPGKNALPLPRVIVVFRGTDLSGDQPSTTCDVCADSILLGNISSVAALPAMCQSYSYDELDYAAQAIAYTRRIMLAYPGSSIRFTGHSLGSALATIVSMKLALCNYLPPSCASGGTCSGSVVNAGVIGVGTVGVVYPALQRLAGTLSPASYAPGAVLLLDQYYDPYYNMSTANGLYGTLCLWWPAAPPSASCELCYAAGSVSVDDNINCALCMADTHIFKHYLALLGGSSGAGSVTMPTCYPDTPEPTCLDADLPDNLGIVRNVACEGRGKCLGLTVEP